MSKEHLSSTANKPKAAARKRATAKKIATGAILQRLAVAPESLRPTHILQMQRAVGNQANLRLLQAKLKLGPAGDAYEQEADRVAKEVVRASRQPDVQREGADEDELQMKPLADGISQVQRSYLAPVQVQRHHGEEEVQASPNHGMEGGDVDADVARSIQSARGGGRPLHDGVRSSMERGFGADFSGVRVHTGGQADALNRSLNARAFTAGSDIFFGQGQYNPGSTGGQELIAHELTHTVQQGAAGRIRRKLNPIAMFGVPGRTFVQRQLEENQKREWQQKIDEGMNTVGETMYNNDSDRARNELNSLLHSVRALAIAFSDHATTRQADINHVNDMFRYLNRIAGLGQGGGYVDKDRYKKKQKGLSKSSMRTAGLNSFFKHNEKIPGYGQKLTPEGESVDDKEGGRSWETMSTLNEDDYGKRALYHIGSGLANLAFPVSLLGILGSMGDTKVRGISTNFTEQTLLDERNLAYWTPLVEFRRAVKAIEAKTQPDLEQEVKRVQDRLTKLLKKRNAQALASVKPQEGEQSVANNISKQWMTKKYFKDIFKNWGRKD